MINRGPLLRVAGSAPADHRDHGTARRGGTALSSRLQPPGSTSNAAMAARMLRTSCAHGVGGIVDGAAEGASRRGRRESRRYARAWGDGADQPVEHGHDEGVAGMDGGQGLVEPRACAAGAGEPLVEVDPVARDAEGGQGVALAP
jgi:hypothetical protein